MAKSICLPPKLDAEGMVIEIPDDYDARQMSTYNCREYQPVMHIGRDIPYGYIRG